MRKSYALLAGLLAIAGMGAPAATVLPTVAPNIPVSTRDNAAKPEPSKAGRRYAHEIIGMGVSMGVFRGQATGMDWIRRRTKNFRPRGVGSRWRFTQRNG